MLDFQTNITETAPQDSSLFVVHCDGAKYLSFPTAEASRFPFLRGSDRTFKYSAVVLENLIAWTAHYSVEGCAKSHFPRPCLFRDFSYAASDEWDRKFFEDLVSPAKVTDYLATMKAAEDYQIDGLVEFMCVGLGCKLRGQEEDAKEILGVSKTAELSDLQAMLKSDAVYSWFDEAVEPKAVKAA